jgi:hypothetical protein
MKKAELLKLLTQVPDDVELVVPGDLDPESKTRNLNYADPYLLTYGMSQEALNREAQLYKVVLFEKANQDIRIVRFFRTRDECGPWLAAMLIDKEWDGYIEEEPVTCWDIT